MSLAALQTREILSLTAQQTRVGAWMGIGAGEGQVEMLWG
jgi:hypothetical protein